MPAAVCAWRNNCYTEHTVELLHLVLSVCDRLLFYVSAGNLVSSASPGVSPLEQLDIAAAAAGGGGDYPPVSRQQLEVQHQLQQRQQLTGAGAYPNITPAVHGIEGFGAAGISTQVGAGKSSRHGGV